MEHQTPNVDRLIRIDEVLHICGLSRSALYASIQKGDFPVQVKLSKKASAWLYSEILAWISERAERRNTTQRI
jgi:prophage regulatory protein